MTTIQAKNPPEINIIDNTINHMIYTKHKPAKYNGNISRNKIPDSSVIAEALWKVLPQAVSCIMGNTFTPWVENHDAVFGVTVKQIRCSKSDGNNGALHNLSNHDHVEYELTSWVEELDKDNRNNIINKKPSKRKVIYRVSSKSNNGSPPPALFDIQKPTANEISIQVTTTDHTLLKLTCIKNQNNHKSNHNGNINWAICDIPRRLKLIGGQYELANILAE